MGSQLASQRVRFQVLARDGFRCQYCGAASTDEGVRLEVDHVYPQALGGTDDLDNLVTACYVCNRGKSAMVLDKLPETVAPVTPTLPPVRRTRAPIVRDVQRAVSPHPRKRLRQVPWSDEVFTSDQLDIIARVQNSRGRVA